MVNDFKQTELDGFLDKVYSVLKALEELYSCTDNYYHDIKAKYKKNNICKYEDTDDIRIIGTLKSEIREIKRRASDVNITLKQCDNVVDRYENRLDKARALLTGLTSANSNGKGGNE